MFNSVEDVALRLREQGYVCSKNIATVVPAGVGKTELAKVVAAATGRNLIRLQCYEGLDEAKALYEWEYSKQLLYTQILKDKFAEAISGATSLRDAADRVGREDSVFFSDRFIVPRPLLRAIRAEELTLLLIDEVDKSDPEFEAFLLEVLSDFQVTVPEIGTLVARNLPFVFLTSNDAREMSDALKRRCLHLYIDFPDEKVEVEILDSKVPGIDLRLAQELVGVMQRLRKLDLKKTPSIAETLDWARALLVLNASELDEALVSDTLNVILKYEGDIRKAEGELGRLITRKTEEKAEPAKTAQTPPPPPAKKGVLH
jgi:MoxR-like ATPase